jgi:hypothetical protein
MGIEFFGIDHTRAHPRFTDWPARVDLDEDDPRGFHLNVGNAAALWPLLGLPLDDGGVPQDGEVSVPEARRALMRARARFERLAPKLVRPTVITYGAPRAQEDGTIEIRPTRDLSFGLDEEGLAARLDRFATFVEALAERGATHIGWA